MLFKDFIALYSKDALGTTPDDAYEGQRALAKGFPSFGRAKPGPGGSVVVTPYNATLTLIDGLIGCSRRRSVEMTGQYADIPVAGSITAGWGADFRPTLMACDLTGASYFGDALKAILAAPELSAQVEEIGLDRVHPQAWIVTKAGTRIDFMSATTATGIMAGSPDRHRVVATLGGGLLHRIALDIAAPTPAQPPMPWGLDFDIEDAVAALSGERRATISAAA